MRRLGALGLVAVLAPGCTFMIDGFYLASDRRYDESVAERRPTGETVTDVEYDAHLAPEGELALVCEERTRSIERRWQVHKTWQRQGGYDRSTYLGTGFLSGGVAALIGLTVGMVCSKEEYDVSCWNALYASPFVVDALWATYRGVTARPAKLVGKDTGGESVALSDAPLATRPVPCDAVAQIMVGTADGSPREAILQGAPAGPRTMTPGALALPLEADGRIALSGQVAALEAWAGTTAELWAVDASGAATGIHVDRCEALWRHAFELGSTARQALEASCPRAAPR